MIGPEQQVAVVAMSCRYPGAPDPEGFWRLLRAGRDGLTHLDDDRLAAAGVPLAERRRSGYVPVAGLLDDPTGVDARALGLSESEAELMDPQQRLFLECAVEALEECGHAGGSRRGTVGVFAGQSFPAYLVDNLGDRFHPRGGADPVRSLHLHGLNVADYLPQRVAWLLGLTGPTLAVGATCATSLVAVHHAVASLLAQECDTALAGGVTLRLPQEQGYVAVPDGPFSPHGQTRAYAAGAAGTVFTQGAGVVVLRRLEDALADGDRVLAVVLGSATGNDGHDRVGFTAPSVAGQVRVLREALAVADVDPGQVGLLEGHGTGTALGDPIEVAALREVFGDADGPWCALRSVKASIGHTDAAAGVAGFIAAVLALVHDEIPPARYADEPAPAVGLDGSAFHLPAQVQPWPEGRRVAGVSAFGVGGVNAHVVLARAPQPPATAHAETGPRGEPVLLVQAADPVALDLRVAQVRDRAAAADLAGRRDLAGTLAHGVRPHPFRAALVGERLVAPPVAAAVTAGAPRLVVGFPGGGAQFAGMASGLHAEHPVFAEALDRVSDRLRGLTGDDPRAIALDASATADRPGTGLPALFAVEIALARALHWHGVRADVVLGHSVGEYAAAVVAGLLDEAEACALVAERSRLMASLPPGGMVSVACAPRDLDAVLRTHPDVDVAAVNGPRLCVLAGARRAVDEIADTLRTAGLDVRRVGVEVAAHSRQVEPVVEDLARAVRGFPARTPTVPFVTTTTARRVEGPLEPEHWPRHLRASVRFADALVEASSPGARDCVLLQLGPGGSVLAAGAALPFRDRIGLVAGADELGVASAGGEAWRAGLARLWARGVSLDLDRLAPRRRAHPVPAYPWQRRPLAAPHRLAADGVVGTGTPPTGEVPSAERPLQRPAWTTHPPLAPVAAPQSGTTAQVLVLGDPRRAARILEVLQHAGLPAYGGGPEPNGHRAHLVVVVQGGTVTEELGRWQGLAAGLRGTEGDAPLVLQVTRGAEPVLGHEVVDPSATAATGLPRVLAQEVEGLRWRTLDLAPGGEDRAPGADPHEDSAVAAEVRALLGPVSQQPPLARHVALRGRRRWLRSWVAWSPPSGTRGPVGDEQTADGSRRWLVTGGFGSLGLALAERLVSEGTPGCRIALLGRSLPAGTGPRAARWRRLVATGVRGYAVDVADAEALARVVRDETARSAPDVVVHAPVVVDLAPLADLDGTAVSAALDPKVRGAENLRVALAQAADARPADRPAPTVLLMSSAAGTVGGFGLGAYVAAGRYLDGLAAREGWLAVDWDRLRLGTEAEAGSASEISMRNALDLDDAVSQLLLLAGARSHGLEGYLAASPSELDSRSRHLARRTARHLATAGTPAAGPDVLGADEHVVAQVWSSVLGRPVEHPDDDFFALGGHSLLATRVLAVLRDEHGVELRLRDLLTSPTVRRCAELLAAARSTSAGPAAPSGPRATEHVLTGFGLTRVQHAYWLGRHQGVDPSAHAPGSKGVGCHFFLEYDAPDLDVERYARAWRHVVARHPMLRTVVDRDGTHRLLDPEPTHVLPVRDLRQWTALEAERELAELRERLSTRVADPARWPLVHPEVVLLPGGGARVLLSVDVLVCDSASWMIVDREVRRLYEEPDAVLPELEVTFGDCVLALEERAGSDEHRRAAAWWRERVPALPPAPDVRAVDAPAAAEPRFERLSARVAAGRWAALVAEATRRRLTPTALVLTTYVDTLRRWSGQDACSVTLTVFDRPDLPGVDAVVGEFSSLLVHEAPVVVGPDTDRWARVAAAQERIAEDLDHRAYGGLEVLAAWSRHRGRPVNVPVVLTSMLGLDRWSGQHEHRHDWLGTYVGGVSQTPQVWLDHQAFEDGGDLVLQWDVCTPVVHLDEARTWFAAYVASYDVAEPSAEPAAAEIETQVVGVWAELLGVAAADVGDSTFLALGGDSLLAVRMAAQVRRLTGVALPLHEVRADVTVADVVGLVAAGRESGQETVLVRRPDASAPFDLLPLQQAYFVGQSGGWDISYATAHVSTDVALTGVRADGLAPALRRAVDAVTARHPMLRARVLDDGTQQLRAPDDPRGEVPVVLHDLREDPDPGAALRHLREGWATAGPDPRTGSGMRVAVVLLPHGRGRLHLASSLLVVDGWSSSIVHRDLMAHLADPNAVLPPLGLDFGDYVATMTAPEARRQAAADLAWWQERLPQLPPAPRLPRRTDVDTAAAAPTMTMREARVDAQRWERFRSACARHGLTPATVLLACYGIALREVTAQPELLLATLQHNRVAVHEDVEAVVGAFSRTALVPLSVDGSSLLEVARAAEESSRVHAEHHRVSAVEVGRMATRGRGVTGSLAPVVFQSTLGMDAALGGDLPTDGGPLGRLEPSDYHQDLRTPQVQMELRVFELAGSLVLSAASVDALFADGLAAHLLESVHRRVLALADDPSVVGAQLEVPDPQRWVGDDVVLGEPDPGVSADAGDGPVSPGEAVAPADLVARIASAWQDVLELPELPAPEDDFFAAGGDSLLAVRLLARLRRDVGVVVEPRAFLHSSTLDALVSLAATATSAAEPALGALGGPGRDPRAGGLVALERLRPSLVELRAGTGRPVFLLHPSGGDVLCYVDLARRLETARPVLALSDPALDGAEPFGSIAEMAETYRLLLRDHQPRGPWTLGGWSMGGTVAHEVARRMQVAGEDVDLLLMIDSNSPERIVARAGLDRAATHELQLLRQVRSAEAFLGLDLGSHADGRALAEALVEAGGAPTVQSLLDRTHVFAAHLDALSGHVAGTLPAAVRTVLVRATQPSPRNSGEGMGVDDAPEHDLGWTPWVPGGLEVVDVEAHHYSIVRGPAVVEVARALSQALAGWSV